MACSCKNNATNKQVTAVKQVVKGNNIYSSSAASQKKPLSKKILFKKHF